MVNCPRLTELTVLYPHPRPHPDPEGSGDPTKGYPPCPVETTRSAISEMVKACKAPHKTMEGTSSTATPQVQRPRFGYWQVSFVVVLCGHEFKDITQRRFLGLGHAGSVGLSHTLQILTINFPHFALLNLHRAQMEPRRLPHSGRGPRGEDRAQLDDPQHDLLPSLSLAVSPCRLLQTAHCPILHTFRPLPQRCFLLSPPS